MPIDQLIDTWRRACEHVGLSHAVQVASGTTIVVPTLARADVSGTVRPPRQCLQSRC